MENKPVLGAAYQLAPILETAWDELLREIEQSADNEELADKYYRATCWLGALVQGRVIVSAAATPLREARDLIHRKTELRLASTEQ